ncbi:hypothetical protein KAJ87_03335 [Candidatus Pacearchaeota archaeon]|nr:hypothetical protein [Candidatus Pacearchaeota archaeon]
MIKENRPLSAVEAVEFVKKNKDFESDLAGFVKKFTKVSFKDSQELRKKLEGLDLMKLKSKNISKIIDILPEDAEDLNKIFVDVSLNEDETKRVLEAIKEFR